VRYAGEQLQVRVQEPDRFFRVHLRGGIRPRRFRRVPRRGRVRGERERVPKRILRELAGHVQVPLPRRVQAESRRETVFGCVFFKRRSGRRLTRRRFGPTQIPESGFVTDTC